MKKSILFVIIALLFAWPAFAEEPKAVVESTVTGIIDVLSHRADPDRLNEKDRTNIRKIVEKTFDFAQMAKRSLGSTWKKLDNDQRRAFIPMFQELLERSYGNRLASYKDQAIEYGAVNDKGRTATVDSLVKDNGVDIPIQYSLYRKDSTWKIYDIKVEGVSLVSTFRSDFKSIFDKGGYTELSDRLQDKIRALKKDDA